MIFGPISSGTRNFNPWYPISVGTVLTCHRVSGRTEIPPHYCCRVVQLLSTGTRSKALARKNDLWELDLCLVDRFRYVATVTLRRARQCRNETATSPNQTPILRTRSLPVIRATFGLTGRQID